MKSVCGSNVMSSLSFLLFTIYFFSLIYINHKQPGYWFICITDILKELALDFTHFFLLFLFSISLISALIFFFYLENF